MNMKLRDILNEAKIQEPITVYRLEFRPLGVGPFSAKFNRRLHWSDAKVFDGIADRYSKNNPAKDKPTRVPKDWVFGYLNPDQIHKDFDPIDLKYLLGRNFGVFKYENITKYKMISSVEVLFYRPDPKDHSEIKI